MMPAPAGSESSATVTVTGWLSGLTTPPGNLIPLVTLAPLVFVVVAVLATLLLDAATLPQPVVMPRIAIKPVVFANVAHLPVTIRHTPPLQSMTKASHLV